MKSRIYSNASATFNILRCGDVHPHPGPEYPSRSQKHCSNNPKTQKVCIQQTVRIAKRQYGESAVIGV